MGKEQSMRHRNMHVKTDTHWRLSEKMVRGQKLKIRTEVTSR